MKVYLKTKYWNYEDQNTLDENVNLLNVRSVNLKEPLWFVEIEIFGSNFFWFPA